MSSNCDQETVPAPPAAKRRKISNSDGVTNSVSHENHSGDQVGRRFFKTISLYYLYS